MSDKPARFFASAAEYRAWLEEHHDKETELWVGFYKKGSGKTGMTYAEAVEQSLCFGWIDGLTQRIDEDTYRQRYTPRKPNSNWSEVNIRRVERLIAEGQMHPAGLRAFEARSSDRSGIYSYENRHAATLTPEQEAQFRAHPAAWEFFQSQPPAYRQTAIWLIASAKREATRQRRLEELIEASARGERIKQLTRSKPAQG